LGSTFELVAAVTTIGAIFAAIFFFMFRAIRNARHLWVDTPLHEREWWVVALVACMAVIGALAGAGPGPDIPLGKLFRGSHHSSPE
jgi:undecaprenyl pyrophosphate phosphatase UppP